MQIGFIGLGNVGGKLAGSLARNKLPLTAFDINADAGAGLRAAGAQWAKSPRALAEAADVVITCLPSPAVCAQVMEGEDGVLQGMAAGGGGKIWAEMSTTDAREVTRLAALAQQAGGMAADCPVSGGCHRAATGNISIFVGGERAVFERLLPVMQVLGRRILHTGGLGSASLLKVVTNYLATANLLSLCEALVACKALNINLNTAYEAIRASSGNSFVHETESQVILNGSRNINFTLDLVHKDLSLFIEAAGRAGAPLELAPHMAKIIADGQARYGAREWSPNIIRRLEEKINAQVLASGFPPEIIDDEPEELGQEIKVQ